MPGGGLLMEQGTGKTLTAIGVAGRAYLNKCIERLLVVAPAAVVPVWPGEFEEYADFPAEVRALYGPVKKKIAQLQEPWDHGRLQVAVVNYESAWRMDEALVKWNPCMVIADESQRIKTPGARQSKFLHKLGKKAKYRMILTGTPVTQSPLDFYSQYKFLDPSIFGTNYAQFRDQYAIMGGYENRQVIGHKNLPELVEKAHSIAFRVTKADALDLPEETTQKLYFELSPKVQKLYKQMVKESVAELESGKEVLATNVLTQLLRLSQLTGGYIGTEEGLEHVGSEKFNLFKETIADILDAGKKVVVFARFTPEIEQIKDYLRVEGIRFSHIQGNVPQDQRGAMVSRFQKDPECKVFVAQIQAAGLGITLTAADTAIFYSMDFSLANYEQAKARIHRLSQVNNVTYIHLLGRKTVDEKIFKALVKKKNIADMVVDKWREFLIN